MIHASVLSASTTLRRLALTPDASAGGWRVTREDGPDPAAALVGRTPQEAARLAPLVFNLCGAAHGFAAASALGLDAAPDAAAMARETVRDHALAILHGWPAILGAAPDRAALARLARPDGAEGMHAALMGDASDLSGFSPAELEAWLTEAPTATARHIARIRAEVDPAEGRAGLPELAAQDVTAALGLAASPGAFGRPTPPLSAPADGGMPPAAHAIESVPPRETGALGRVARAPLFRALLATEGPSLFVRLLARLADCLAALRPVPPDVLRLPPGIAPAARGLLGHAARVEDGRVAAYRILSPSAWNLAPGGLLERAFAALTPGRQARWIAPLLVCAINPCVPVDFAFEREAVHA